MMDVAEAGLRPNMHCNDPSLTHADVVYFTAFRRRGFGQRGPKITVSGALVSSSLSTKTETSSIFKSPMNPQYYHHSNLCTLYPSNMELVV